MAKFIASLVHKAVFCCHLTDSDDFVKSSEAGNKFGFSLIIRTKVLWYINTSHLIIADAFVIERNAALKPCTFD